MDVSLALQVTSAGALVMLAVVAVIDKLYRSRKEAEYAERVMDNALRMNERTQGLLLKHRVIGTTERMSQRHGDVAPIFAASTSTGLLKDEALPITTPENSLLPDNPLEDLPDDYNVGVLGGSPVSFDVPVAPNGKRVS